MAGVEPSRRLLESGWRAAGTTSAATSSSRLLGRRLQPRFELLPMRAKPRGVKLTLLNGSPDRRRVDTGNTRRGPG